MQDMCAGYQPQFNVTHSHSAAFPAVGPALQATPRPGVMQSPVLGRMHSTPELRTLYGLTSSEVTGSRAIDLPQFRALALVPVMSLHSAFVMPMASSVPQEIVSRVQAVAAMNITRGEPRAAPWLSEYPIFPPSCPSPKQRNAKRNSTVLLVGSGLTAAGKYLVSRVC